MQNNEDEKYSLIDEQPDYIPTDIIMDLKSGIYNLFVSMINHNIMEHGPQKAVVISVNYLKEIVDHFEKAIETNEQEKP
jgi:hypothetical protein